MDRLVEDGAGWKGSWARLLWLVVPVLVWVASIGALMEALRANEAAALTMRTHGGGSAVLTPVGHLRGLAVLWSAGLTGLQILALVVGAGMLRGFYRLRSAVCFAVSGGGVILLNTAWLFGLLVWMRMYGDTR